MKTKTVHLSVLLTLFSIILSAQIPNGYYTSAENMSGVNLKSALNQIIDNHTEFPYTSSNTDVWDILKETDRDPNNSDNVILIYSGVSVDAYQEYNSANGWTREHVWAKSRGDFGTTTGAGTDVHALRPLDNATNSTRSNRSFNDCSNCQNVSDTWNDVTGSQIDSNDWSFEPRDEVKGDVARMLFYMVVRYEGLDGYVDLEPTESMLPQSNIDPTHGVWSTLMDWHRNDPVDSWEENRNDVIYYSYQNNRNPFIDFPELAEHLWGTKTTTNWAGDNTLSVATFNEDNIMIYPNPASNFVNVKGLNSIAEVIVYDASGRKVLVSKVDRINNKINVSELTGVYVLKIIQKENVISKRLIIN
jgi:endonuclease I